MLTTSPTTSDQVNEETEKVINKPLISPEDSTKPTNTDRESFASGLERAFARKGINVVPELSGEDKTTITLTSKEFTSESIDKWLYASEPDPRASMRLAGFHLLIISDGQQSWTFKL